ncbi:MAG: hypothetical protein LAT56_11715 [Wenzhouxiangella sp.]|nr:hypothetical protein [Wenzhouxiangella sp.]
MSSPRTIMLTWEMGGGHGHLVRLGRIGKALIKAGHRLVFVSRDVAAARAQLPEAICLQAPFHLVPAPPYPKAANLAEIMDNIGLGQTDSIAELTASWLTLVERTGADAVAMDFSPGALLALQALPMRRVLIDNGYSHPTHTPTLPSLRPWESSYTDFHDRIELRVLAAVNASLKQRGLPPLAHLSELFLRVDAIHLMTIPELDHTGPKTQVHYRGYLDHGGQTPVWPRRYPNAPRLLIMLKSFRGLVPLLAALSTLELDLVIAVTGLDADSQAALADKENLSFHEGWLDLRAAARQADLVLCAGGEAVGIVLLQGTPVCVLPFFDEQRLTAERAAASGAALALPAGAPPEAVVAAIQQMLAKPSYAQRAAKLAGRYRGLDQAAELAAIVGSLVGSEVGGLRSEV